HFAWLLFSRYTLYTKTKLGYMFYKRQVKKAREHHPTGHSVTQPTVLNGVKIIPISVIEDNYSYLIIDTTSDTAVAVDPSDPQVVQGLKKKKKKLLFVKLRSLKERDHSGGNKTLKKLYKKCRVYGSSTDNIPGLTEPAYVVVVVVVGSLALKKVAGALLTQGQSTHIIKGITYPGRAWQYMIEESSVNLLLSSLLSNLSLCFCSPHHPGHEYAQDNLKFAAEIEPNNTECEAKFQWVMTQRQGKLCTCPSTIGEEKSYNPFLRTHLQELHEALGLQHTPDDDFTRFRAQVLEEVRKRKDLFKAR
uniref:PNKD metallo-beta-lactamase domain containing n=1 Tax=Latimeria chalumnae TaxID=7897 RepID=H3AMD9_LATCH